MEGKIVILSALLVCLVLGQIQVEAKLCCLSDEGRFMYADCEVAGGSMETCEAMSGCTNFNGNVCPSARENDILKNTGDNAVNKYCKLGCVSSVCGAITTLKTSDASDIVNGAAEKCINTCATFCTKGSITAIKNA